jgi:hypothetical protein
VIPVGPASSIHRTGDAVDFRLKDGQTIQLVERTGVTVCGRLSFGAMKPNPRAVLLLADAIVE